MMGGQREKRDLLGGYCNNPGDRDGSMVQVVRREMTYFPSQYTIFKSSKPIENLQKISTRNTQMLLT